MNEWRETYSTYGKRGGDQFDPRRALLIATRMPSTWTGQLSYLQKSSNVLWKRYFGGEAGQLDDLAAEADSDSDDDSEAERFRKQQARTQEFTKDPDEVDWDEKAQNTKNPVMLGIYLYRAKRERLKNKVISYGPPYEEDYGGDILEECAKMNASPIEMHMCLNYGANPNLQNPKDSMNTCMHYSARHCHWRILKMCRRAGADMNKENELGLTPLATCCQFQQPPALAKVQLKIAKYLLDHGADVNHVDKGGHTPMEYAAFTGNLELVTLLLKYGGRVLRDTEFLSLVSANAVDLSSSMETRALLQAKLDEERAFYTGLREERERMAYVKEMRKHRASNARKAILARQAQRRAKIDARVRNQNVQITDLSDLIEDRKKKQRAARDEAIKKLDHSAGAWEKQEHMQWDYVRGLKKEDAYARTVLHQAQDMMHEIYERNSSKMIQTRWRELTGTDLLKPMERLREPWEIEMEANDNAEEALPDIFYQ